MYTMPLATLAGLNLALPDSLVQVCGLFSLQIPILKFL